MSAIIKLLSKFDDSGIRKAKSSFSGLGKTIGALGIGIGLTQITRGLSTAVENAQEDVISQRQLARQLTITAKATKQQVAAQEDYITKLSMTTGVVDDKLRPSFSVLLRATGSVRKSQELLNLSLDTSAGTGKDLEIVTKSIARAYGGNITGLQKLVPGIKKGSDAMGFLKEQFAGARETMANPFDQLTIAVDETKEKLGMALLPTVQTFVKYLISDVIPTVDQFFTDVANPKTDIGQAFAAFGDTVDIAQQNLKHFFAMMDPKKEGNAMSGFAASLEWIAVTLSSVIDGFTVLIAAGDKFSRGNYGEAAALLMARTDIGAMAVRNNIDVKDQIAAINKQTKAKGSGMFITDSQGGLSGVQDNVLFGSPKPKKAIVPLVFKSGMAGQTINNVTINVQGADPKSTVDALGKYVKQNGSLPFNLTKVGRTG